MGEGNMEYSDSWRQRKQNQTANDLTIESLHLVDSLSANGNLCLSLCLSSHIGDGIGCPSTDVQLSRCLTGEGIE